MQYQSVCRVLTPVLAHWVRVRYLKHYATSCERSFALLKGKACGPVWAVFDDCIIPIRFKLINQIKLKTFNRECTLIEATFKKKWKALVEQDIIFHNWKWENCDIVVIKVIFQDWKQQDMALQWATTHSYSLIMWPIVASCWKMRVNTTTQENQLLNITWNNNNNWMHFQIVSPH